MLPRKSTLKKDLEFAHGAGFLGLAVFLLIEIKIALINPELFHATELYMGITAIVSFCAMAKGVKNKLEKGK